MKYKGKLFAKVGGIYGGIYVDSGLTSEDIEQLQKENEELEKWKLECFKQKRMNKVLAWLEDQEPYKADHKVKTKVVIEKLEQILDILYDE